MHFKTISLRLKIQIESDEVSMGAVEFEAFVASMYTRLKEMFPIVRGSARADLIEFSEAPKPRKERSTRKRKPSTNLHNLYRGGTVEREIEGFKKEIRKK